MNRQFLRVWLVFALALVLGTPVLHAQDAAAPPAEQPNANEIVVPEGTEFKLQLHTSINSKTSNDAAASVRSFDSVPVSNSLP